MPEATVGDLLTFIVLPYVALVLFVGVSIYRYRNQGFSYSALTSQTLENRLHFWGIVPFHWGILVVLAGHLAALAIPDVVLAWNATEARLLILEITGLACALLALGGLVVLIIRRFIRPKPRIVWSSADRVLHAILFFQILTGILIAITIGWGSSWFTSTATPYIWSLLTLQPDIDRITPLPRLVQAHIALAWIFIAVFPFTRMVHALVAPLPYLWRRPQVARWWRESTRP